DRIIPGLQDRPLSVIRVHRGQEAFMQKNVPKYTPPFVRTVQFWAETSKREVSYALCNDRRTLLWFANQRAVEYHPTLVRADRPAHVTDLVLELDPPDAAGFAMAVRAARLVRQALDDVAPADFNVHTALGRLDAAGPWLSDLSRQALPPELVEEGTVIPSGRVQAMHEGKRRARSPKAGS